MDNGNFNHFTQGNQSDHQGYQPDYQEYPSDYRDPVVDGMNILGYDLSTGDPIYGNSKPEQLKKKPMWFKLVAIILLVLVLGGGVFICSKAGVFMSTEQKVLSGIANMLTTDKNSFMEREFGWSQLVASTENENVENGINIATNMISALGVGEIGLELTDKKNADTKEASYSFAAKAGASTLVEGMIYVNEPQKETQIYVPMLYKDIMVYNWDRPAYGLNEYYEAHDLNRDTLYELQQLPEIGIIEQIKFRASMKKVLKKFTDSISQDTLGQKAFILDGKTVFCKGYRFRINNEDLKVLIDEFDDALKKNPSFENLFTTTIRQKDNKASIHTYLDDLRAELNELPNMPLVLDAYMKGRQIVGLKIKLSLEQYEILNLNIEAGGGYSLYENVKMEFTAGVAAKSFHFSISRKGDTAEKDRVSTMIIETNLTDKLIEYKNNYDRVNKTVAIEISQYDKMYPEEKELFLSANGRVSQAEKGKDIRVEMDEIHFPILPDASFEGSYYIQPLSGGVDKPTGNEVNLNEADKKELENIFSPVATDYEAKINEIFDSYFKDRFK